MADLLDENELLVPITLLNKKQKRQIRRRGWTELLGEKIIPITVLRGPRGFLKGRYDSSEMENTEVYTVYWD